jgi:3-phenylpropionate/trans-cinnamate dioxygenase ferredoxin reductase subunit
MAGPVVVVGAGLAGLRVAEELRRVGFDGKVTLVGGETHPPYDRPPLSKEVLRGDRSVADIRLRPDDFFHGNEVDLRLGVHAVGLDRRARKVELDDGPPLEYEHLVIATGIVPKRPGFLGNLSGVHLLRTADDVLALRQDIGSARAALVIGAGFIGCEVAAGFRALGLDVVLVEPLPAPLAGALGAEVGGLVARLHTAAGVDLRCGVGVSELLGEDAVTGARLSDGSTVDADVVVCGVGSTPATGWLEESGIELGDGVLCDESGRTNDPRVWAIGDVAAWRRPPDDHHVRVEHWTEAGEQATVVAKAIHGADPGTRDHVPYFWSDQHGLKIQALGHFEPDDEVRVLEDDGRKFAVVYSRDGVLTGAVAAGLARRVMKMRPLLVRGAGVGEVAELG